MFDEKSWPIVFPRLSCPSFFQTGDSSRLTFLSLSNCNLSDDDVSVLFSQVGPQLRLETLNLSVNRIADAGIAIIIDKLLEMQGENHNTLIELNLANNRVHFKLINKFMNANNGRDIWQWHSLNHEK